MTEKEIIAMWIDCYNHESENVLKARIKDKKESKTTLRCELIDFVDYLEKDKQITHNQAFKFTCPSWLY